MTAPASYVFKLHYDDGPVHVSRRYGYSGKLDVPAVYSGLYERTAQVMNLAPGSFTLALRDSLGKSSIKLDDYNHFHTFVCQPVMNNFESVKVDEKGRRVLVFIVEKKRDLNHAPSTPASAGSSTGRSDANESIIDYAPLSTSGTDAFDALSKRFEPLKPRTPSSSSSVAATTNKFERQSSEPRFDVQKPGYHPAYASSSLAPDNDTSGSVQISNAAQSLIAAQPSADAPRVQQPKTESWATVRGMLETFVRDLNVHLADTFGDEAGSFRLNTSVQAKPEQAAQSEARVPAQAANAVETKAIHAHVFCDRCLKTISGSRFKCRACSNYDLCDFCIDFRGEFHSGAHPFAEITHPGAAAISSTRGAITVEDAPVPPPQSRTAPAAPPPSDARPARPMTHNATCDGCDKTIVGTRKKCVNCPDYDLCAQCHASASTIHPGHNFASIHTPRDLEWHSPTTSTPVHHHVRCDGCNKSPIRGVRYKCTHPSCPDYDLCGNCEADPIARHPADHLLLKIRQPRSNVFGVAAHGLSEAVRRAQEMSQHAVRGPSLGHNQRYASPLATLFSSIGAAVQGHAATSSAQSGSHSPQSSPVSAPSETAPAVNVEPETVEAEAKVESESSEDETEVEEEEPKEVPVENESRLGCSFVADVTLHDGTVVPAGSEFCKVWKVRNTGTLAWSSARLVNVGGFQGQKQSEGFEVADLEPGQETEVQCECKAPEEDGRFMSFFRLEDADGVKFGDRFWLDITVESAGTLRSSGTLSSSSIITPSLNAGGKAASVPATTTSTAPSTTFSLSEVETDFESVSHGTFSSRPRSGIVVESDSEEEDHELSSSEESSELEEDSDDDDFVVLSDEGDAWRD